MKLQPDRFDTQAITGHGPGWVAVNGEPVRHSLVVSARGDRLDWQAASFEALTPAHFEQLLALRPELVVFGSGERLRFPPPALLRALVGQNIGVETMDTAAACRTYNILAGEGRRVVAALLVQAAASGAAEQTG
jgi:uncharacterized protein